MLMRKCPSLSGHSVYKYFILGCDYAWTLFTSIVCFK